MFDWLKKGKEKTEGGAAVLEKESHDLKVKVLERKACVATISVVVPAAEVSAAIEAAYGDVQKKAKLPGFRPGKAPMEMIKKNFHGHAVEHGINELLRETVQQALEQEKIVPLTVPSVDKVDYHEGKPLKYEVKVECPPEVVLKNYKGLPIAKKSAAVSDQDVAQRLDSLRENNAKLAPSTDDTLTEKHFAVVDYEASLDGQPVEGGKAEDHLVELSAQQSLAGFNDALKGMKKGETKETSIPFPADHPNKTLAGKSVVFKISVKEIKEKQLPAADDEFAKDLGLESLAQLNERLRKNLEAERVREARQDEEKQVIDALLERHPFEVPPSLVEDRARRLTERMKELLSQQSPLNPDDWAKNEPRLLERNRPEAEKQVRLSYLLIEIADKEKIEATDADVDEAIAKASQDAAAEKLDEMKKWFESRRENLKAQLKEEKIFSFLIEHAQKTEPKPS